ncbi:MAG TPA: alcohol dehydrogenase catalytic domain-containing protein [Candidatus Sumerlaeota bacterium]|nr:alcohol dehydrogenase catalytic domain-containing protein [Candidatus Sumerlaeota bacterium]
MTTTAIPQKQYAVQLVGPSQLKLNPDKDVPRPGPHQVLAKIEAVGLCFSDLKLLKQFSEHARKKEVVKGLSEQILNGIPSYVPADKPTVPGHEVVLRIVAVGDNVKHHKVGERCIVQADYRNLRTSGSNAAFGYNFEGGLQEYVLMDERVVVDEDGERFLIPVKDDIGASQVALVEPWACVEDSYVTRERQSILAAGRLLVVADAGHAIEGLRESFSPDGPPASITIVCVEDVQLKAIQDLGLPVEEAIDPVALPDEGFDDIVYFGASKPTLDVLNDKLAAHAIINVVKGGKRIGEPVAVGVGRVHYGPTRWIGTDSTRADDAYRNIPPDGDIRDGDSVLVVGAGGPMGQMHVIRNVCAGRKGVSVTGSDLDAARLAALEAKARPMAAANNVSLRMVNSKEEKLDQAFSYYALMAPVGQLVADAIRDGAEGMIINIFAGIPAPVKHDLDLDTYFAKRAFMFGTSGSTIRDMKIVLEKVESGQLNTNASVDAIAGMSGATDGIAAVENRTMAGKIIVYPQLHDVPLIPLSELGEHFPTVAAKLDDGQWTPAAEAELLRVAKA